MGWVFYGAMAYDEKHRQFVAFGGRGREWSGAYSQYDETLLSNGHTLELVAPRTSPPARDSAAMWWDPVSQRVMLFGGRTSGNILLNDTWAWDGVTWTQVLTAVSPPPRRFAAVAYLPSKKVCYLFGGSSAGGGFTVPMDDLWQWDGRSWLQIAVAGARPRGEALPAMAYSGVDGKIVLISKTKPRREWQWDGAAWEERRVPIDLEDVSRLREWQGGLIWMTVRGGYWWTRASRGKWTRTSTRQRSMFVDMSAYDPHTKTLVVVNGDIEHKMRINRYDGFSWVENDICEPYIVTRLTADLDGSLWSVSPDGTSSRPEVWTYRSGRWFHIRAVNGGPVGSPSSVVYDESLGGLICSFGSAQGVYLFKDATWRMLPWPKFDFTAQFVRMTNRSATVVYDGSDVWESVAGGPMLRVIPVGVAPVARTGGGVGWSYDPVLGLAYMFGGAGHGKFYNDLWAWNGTRWFDLSATTREVPGRIDAKVVRLGVGPLLIVGGGARNIFNDGRVYRLKGLAFRQEACAMPTSCPGLTLGGRFAPNHAMRSLVYVDYMSRCGSEGRVWMMRESRLVADAGIVQNMDTVQFDFDSYLTSGLPVVLAVSGQRGAALRLNGQHGLLVLDLALDAIFMSTWGSMVAVANAEGAARFKVQLPVAPSYSGQSVFFAAVALSATATPVSTSESLRVLLR